jgi:XRE family aerobic/anaerobic benzoate catabolism transcriptional regulator
MRHPEHEGMVLTKKPSSRRRDKLEHSVADDGNVFLCELGRQVRLGRAKRGISRRKLAADSGLSERYLAQIEGGSGNPSIMVLKAIARAIDVPIIELLPQAAGGTPVVSRIIELVGRTPPSELPAIAGLIEARLAEAATSDRGRRISLVGLRGGGKSTLGRRLAEQLGCPFLELNRIVEQEYGASTQLLIEMSGLNTFRRYERSCLERVIDEHDTAVIATAGGMVSNPETYALLLRRTHAIWIKAKPEEHMNRVMAQGDFRPMAQNREAMSDLIAILDARRDDYSQAAAVVDTSGETVEQSFAKLLDVVRRYLDETGKEIAAAPG